MYIVHDDAGKRLIVMYLYGFNLNYTEIKSYR